jgi:hypothetical protein
LEEQVGGCLRSVCAPSDNAPSGHVEPPEIPVATAAIAACPTAPSDADLAAVVERWATLPAAIRAGIVAMVKATAPGS